MASKTLDFDLRCELWSKVSRLSFGCCVDEEVFVDHFSSDEVLEDMRIVFQNYKKKVVIQLKVMNERSKRRKTSGSSVDWFEDKYEFVVNYSQIKSIHFKDNKMVFKLLFPPLLYNICEDHYMAFGDTSDLDEVMSWDSGNEEDIETNKMTSDIKGLINDCDVLSSTDYGIISSKPHNRSLSSIDSSEDYIGFRLRTKTFSDINETVFTKSNALYVELDFTSHFMADIISNLKAFDPLIAFNTNCFQTIECKTQSIDFSQTIGLSFDILYSLTSLTNHSFYLSDILNFKNNCKQFMDLIKELIPISEESVDKALNDLRVKIENNLDMNPIEDLKKSFNRHNNQNLKKWTNSSVIPVRRIILSPTRILLLPALPLQQSRFLRITDPKYVIRLLIKDEDFQSLSFTVCNTSALPEEHEFCDRMKIFLQKAIFDRLRNGIEIAGRTYEVLGASTSQLRDHGLVLYARDGKQRSVRDLIEEIGELNAIQNAGKYIARIGQSMSQSMSFVSNVDCIQMIDDIKDGVHGLTEQQYIFSDGVGMISKDMAQELCEAIGKNVPTFQIRYSGCKGLLVVNPSLEGKKILMRKSMEKFVSKSTDLDILKVCEPRSCYLNRPLITILNQMGVSNKIFLRLLFKRFKELSNAFVSNSNAIRLLSSYSGLKLNYKQFIDSEIDVLNEPFFVSIIESIITKVSLDLKNKARILVPFDSGRVMFGVLDETKTLRYGQVFVQYSDLQSGAKRVLIGEVLVTKYPCMHPGDVRKLEAIDVPGLHHIFDCVVFPAQGKRPHPDEMAGSDLDGDEYNVIWYKPLIFDRHNYDPMHFPSGEAEDLGRGVTTEDILSFYCRFIANNQVGMIATSHMVWADATSRGIFSGVCKELDYKYATALDFAKTGMNARLRNSQKPKRYPDFMQKPNERVTYESKNALGKLYQMNCYFNELINEYRKQNCFHFKPNPKLIDNNSSTYMKDAKQKFDSYCNAIRELKQQFGIESESALVSSMFTKTHKYLSTHNDNNDTHELVSNITNRLFDDFLKEFESRHTEAELEAKASAWYLVCHENNSNVSDESERYYGFPWIVSKYLVKLWNKNNQIEDTMKTSENCTEICLHRKDVKSIIKILFNKYFENILNNKTLNIYIEDNIDEVLQKYGSDMNAMKAMNEIFDKFIANIEDNSENEYIFKVSFVSQLLRNKCQTIGFKEAVENSIRPTKDIVSYDTFVVKIVSVWIRNSDDLNQTISDSRNESQFRQFIKQRTDVKQMDIRYSPNGNDSYICVFGRTEAIGKFVKLVINDKNNLREELNRFYKI